jgi:hypothetical protein
VPHTVDALISSLQQSLAETVVALSALSDDDLDVMSDHPCAMGGTVRDLLTHNIDHERMHVGQVYSARYALKHMQKSEVHRLIAETIRARTELIAALVGLTDSAVALQVPDEDWTIREMVEHTIYWERDSVDDLLRRLLAGHRPAASNIDGHGTDAASAAPPPSDTFDATIPTPAAASGGA